MILLVLFLQGPAWARTAELIEHERVLLPGTSTHLPTTEDARAAIILGGQHLGWRVTGDNIGRITLFYNRKNKHTITIHVIYDAYGFQVRYADSTNMNYEKVDENTALIHPNYNRWINNLIKEIPEAMKEVNAAKARAELIRALKSPSSVQPTHKEQP